MSVKGYYFPFKSNAGSDLEQFLPQDVECVVDLNRLPECYAEACAGKARVFLDMPTNVPGIEFGKDTSAGYRRTVVCTDFFGAALPINTIVIQHQAVIREVKTPVKAVLAAARVAGYRHACFGLPEEQSPLLFTHPECKNVLISAAALGNFIRGRFAPQCDWQTVIGRIIGFLDGSDSIVPVTWTMSVHPSFSADAELDKNSEMRAFRRNADWFYDRMLCRLHGGTMVFEGFAGQVAANGVQPVAPALRCDCTGETALVGALDFVLNQESRGRDAANELLESLFVGQRLIDSNPASQTYGSIFFDSYVNAVYGDDCARAAFSALLSGELLKDDRHLEAIMRVMLSIYRTTGVDGLRHESLRQPISFTEGRSYRYYAAEHFRTVRPHYQATNWALNLQAYVLTGYEDFLLKAKSAIRIAMTENFPDFLWTNGITQEWARIILPLAMLVEVEDTPEHRQWLDMAVKQLQSVMERSGAIREMMGDPAKGRYPAPRSNEAYGTNESSLIQINGDPACDLLYTMNYAFLGMHEAAMATDNAEYHTICDRMADFFCRIQSESAAHPELSGCWIRGFDFDLWEYFGSSADIGWGAWCVESGWTNTWISAIMGLRKLRRPLLCREFAAKAKELFPKLRSEMLDYVFPSVTKRGLVVEVDNSIPLTTPGND